MTAVASSRRVLLVHTSAGMYGADQACLLIARGLREVGREVTVVLPYRGRLTKALLAADVRVVFCRVGAVRRVFTPGGWLKFLFFDLPASIFAIWRLARSHDVVHVNTSVAVGALIGARLAGRPVVVHLRESYGVHARAWRVYSRFIRRFASAVVTISQWIDDEAAAAGLTRRRLIHDAAARIPAVSADHSTARSVCVGRLNEWKGHLVLIDAAAELVRRDRPVIVTCVGDVFQGGELYRETLLRRIAELGLEDIVLLVGETEDVDAYLGSHSIFVSPTTRAEPFGIALLEAMSAGLACIATDAGGPRDLIDSGRNGLLVPLGDSVALADAMDRLAGDEALRRQLGAAAAQDVRDRFSADLVRDAVDELHSELLAG